MNTDRLQIMLEGKPCYEIVFEKSFEKLKEELLALGAKDRKICVITDSNVNAIYGDEILQLLEAQCRLAVRFVIPAGEESKNLGKVQEAYRFLIEEKFDRKDLLLALGGGVVGDLTGFVAATYLRGVDFVQIPTTLLAQVDSALGGKTALDLPEGKNLLGAFHQPSLVLSDPACLATLPQRQFASGMAEVIKYGFIRDAALLELLETDAPEWTDIIARCLRVKAALVAADERDTGTRRLLNFGHTFGHAYEAAGGYGAYTHGEAVAAGMAAMLRWQLRRGDAVAEAYHRLLTLLERWGLPASLPVAAEELAGYMKQDKKREGETLHAVLLRAAGDACVEDVPLAALLETVR